MIEIVENAGAFDEEWNAFVAASPRASFYHRAEWRRINETCFGHRTAYLAARQDNRIVGVFPLVQLRSVLFGNIGCSLPFVNFGGPAGEDDRIEAQLLDAAARVCERWRVDYLEIRCQRQLDSRYPSSDHKVSMTVDLAPDPDTLWNAFKSSHRTEIRKGYKNGLTVKIGRAELLDDFYTVLSESWRDLGTPMYAKTYFQEILGTFPEETRICVVYAGDQPAAAAFDGLHGNTVEGMWLGMRAQFRHLFVGYVLYWELIKHACEQGFTRFHLGRSTTQSGGEAFKRKWNAQPTQLYWHYILRTRTDVPQLNPSAGKYKLAIAAWRKLPIGVTQHLGPLIARSIP